MVLDAVNLTPKRTTWKSARQLRLDRRTHALIAQPVSNERKARPLHQGIARPPQDVRLWIAVQCNMPNVRYRRPGFREAIADSFGGKPRPVLDAPEPFLLRSRDDLPVPVKTGRGITMIGV